MKLGVSYNIFDGEELLKDSIKSIRENVDYISVVYQEVSNFGNPCDPNLIPLLNKLKDEGLVDELHKYKPQPQRGGHFNEITKRNIGVFLSQGNGCTHHMAMDSDEFYTDEQFKFLKKTILEGDYDSSACQMCTYYKEPIYQLDPKEEYYVSLIFKIDSNSKYELGCPFPVLVDPTRNVLIFLQKLVRPRPIDRSAGGRERSKILRPSARRPRTKRSSSTRAAVGLGEIAKKGRRYDQEIHCAPR